MVRSDKHKEYVMSSDTLLDEREYLVRMTKWSAAETRRKLSVS